jgi:hypothetical protein
MATRTTVAEDAKDREAREALDHVRMGLNPLLQEWFPYGLGGRAKCRRAGSPDALNHWESLRDLQDGHDVIVRETGPERRWRKYRGKVAKKVRDLRRGSSRMLIRLPDGVEALWPMNSLEIPRE